MSSIFHQLVNVLLHVFKDKVEIIIDTDHFFEFDNIDMVELAEGFDLAKSHALLPTVKLLFHLLNCDLLVSLLVDGLDDGPVGTVSQGFEYLVAIHTPSMTIGLLMSCS